jgi:hypothetical protein
MSGAEELSERLKYGLLAGFALLMGGVAFLFNSPREIYEGNLTILASPANLLTDYMALTNVGSALFNVSLMTLQAIWIVRMADARSTVRS